MRRGALGARRGACELRGARREAWSAGVVRGVGVRRAASACACVDELRRICHSTVTTDKQSEPASCARALSHKITVVLRVNRRFGAIEKVSNCQFRMNGRARRLAPYRVKR